MIDLRQIKDVGKDLPQERTNPAPGFLCLYTAPDGQHCIVGEICKRLGLEVPECLENDNKVAIGYLAINEKGRYHGLFTPEAIVWASQAQLLGQMGYSWRVCTLSADNSVAPQINMHTEAANAR